MSKYAGDYRGWTPRCHGRNQECENHRGVRIGWSGICLIDHLEAMARGGGINAKVARERLRDSGWAT